MGIMISKYPVLRFWSVKNSISIHFKLPFVKWERTAYNYLFVNFLL